MISALNLIGKVLIALGMALAGAYAADAAGGKKPDEECTIIPFATNDGDYPGGLATSERWAPSMSSWRNR